MNKQNEFYRLSEIARELNLTAKTVKNHFAELEIEPFRTKGGLILLDSAQRKAILAALSPKQSTSKKREVR